MHSYLEVRDLQFTWDAASPGIDVPQLAVEAGKIYGLLGRNGAGKTTLLKLLTGCLRPHAGRATMNALDVRERRPDVLCEVVFVTENCELPSVRADQYGALAGALYPRFSQQTFLAHLGRLEVPANVAMGKLSFGQRRKVLMAFALATGARLVVLDEPTNGLDVVAQVNLRKLLIEHVSEERSLIVSTHHVREFETVIDEVIVLEHGRVMAQEPLETLRETAGFDGLESWYMRTIGAAKESA